MLLSLLYVCLQVDLCLSEPSVSFSVWNYSVLYPAPGHSGSQEHWDTHTSFMFRGKLV